jgi:stage II sporulation protein D
MFTLKRTGQTIVFEGKGSGHGVGMSQWGAYMMALDGFSFFDILKFYYPGLEIKK